MTWNDTALPDPVEKALPTLTAEAAARGVPISASSLRKFGWLVTELRRWNQQINLTAIDEPAAALELHVLDSLLAASLLPEGAQVVDVGTGGGFPTLPLAIHRADLRLQARDRTAKKLAFVRHAAATLTLTGVQVRHVRVESGAPREAFDVAISRAFTAPAAWLALARGLVRPGGRVVVMMGAEEAVPATLLGPGDRLLARLEHRLPSGARRVLWSVEVG